MGQTLEQIYREHRQGLFTLALSITRDRLRAEDAVHEAFARLVRQVNAVGETGGVGGSGGEGDPVAYAFAAVRNAAKDELRRRAAQNRLAQSIYETQAPSSPHEDSPVDALLDDERQRLVRDAIDTLPDDVRQIVVMKVYGGLTFDQIARAMDAPLATIASRYRRALDKLRDAIDSRDPISQPQ